MNGYSIPEVKASKKVNPAEALLVTSGDLRQSANRVCWPAQACLEETLSKAFAAEGVTLVRAHPHESSLQHGLIYAPCEETANKALAPKATLMAEMGIAVHMCGTCLNNLHQ